MREAAGILTTLTSQWYRQQRAREKERERGSWRHYRKKKKKQLRSPHVSSASLFMWLSGSGLRQNQTPAGHLMIERISELIGRCWGIWTQMTYSTHGCTEGQDTSIPSPIHTQTSARHACTRRHVCLRCHTVTVRVMDQSRLKLSWILHGVWCGRRIIIERSGSYLRLLEIQLSLTAFCHAVVDSDWWSVAPGHLGISLFFLRGSNRDWNWQPNRNLIKLKHKQTLWIQTLHGEEACHAPLSNQNARSKAGTPEVFALQIWTWVTEICKIMFRAMVKSGTCRQPNNEILD